MRILSEEHALMRSYAIAMCMLALLDEWKKQERMGAVAKIYNSITLKNNNFHTQIYELHLGEGDGFEAVFLSDILCSKRNNYFKHRTIFFIIGI